MRQGRGGAGGGVRARSHPASAASHSPQGECRPRLGAYFLGRSPRPGRGQDARRKGQSPAIPGFRRGYPERHGGGRQLRLGSPPGPCLPQPQPGIRHRELQLAQGLRPGLHLRRRHRHAGLRTDRLHPVVGVQPRHFLAIPGNSGAAGTETRRQTDRGRSASRRTGSDRRPVAAPTPRQRRRLGAGPGPYPDRDRALRPRLPHALERRPFPGGRRQWQPADRRRPVPRRRQWAARCLGRRGGCCAGLPRAPAQCRLARLPGFAWAFHAADPARLDFLQPGIRLSRRTLPRLACRPRRGSHRYSRRADRGGGKFDRGKPAPVVFHLDWHLPARQRHPDRPWPTSWASPG